MNFACRSCESRGIGGFTTSLISDTLGRPKQCTHYARERLQGLASQDLMKVWWTVCHAWYGSRGAFVPNESTTDGVALLTMLCSESDLRKRIYYWTGKNDQVKYRRICSMSQGKCEEYSGCFAASLRATNTHERGWESYVSSYTINKKHDLRKAFMITHSELFLFGKYANSIVTDQSFEQVNGKSIR